MNNNPFYEMIGKKRFEKLKKIWEQVERTLFMGFSWNPNAGNGDLITNECRRILKEGDRSNHAKVKLHTMFSWLACGKRWGDNWDEFVTTTNHKQTDITKDPWVYALCTARFLGRHHIIEAYPPPRKPTGDKWRKWSYFNFIEWRWYKALLKGKRCPWLFIRHFIVVPHTYVMYGFMHEALKKY